MEIKTTTNYELFSFIQGNREIDNRHVNKLIKSIKEQNLPTPIVVNEKMEIVDGQHRFYAQKALQLPINYIVINGIGLEEVQKLNTNKKNWANLDYAKSYARLNNPHYAVYLAFREKYGFSHTNTLVLLSKGYTTNITGLFHNGLFIVKDLEQAEKWAINISAIAKWYDGYKRTGFIRAIVKLFKIDKFSFDLLIKRISGQSMKLTNQATVEDNYKMLVNIYNYHTPKGKKLPTYF